MIIAIGRKLIPEREMAEEVGQSKISVHNLLLNQNKRRRQTKLGRPSKMTYRQRREIIHLSSTVLYSASRIVK